ncbi:MAG: PD-(D/E)XK nuclease family protein [Patescibacteria group bacterium]|nr:PD-(D/E)XK nuclease family protein [Patescibacteria group bacterium]
MSKDKYTATWVSHSSMGDFLKCPRAYYLHNVYKNPNTGRKINIINPSLALGIAVHEVLENLSNFSAEERMKHCNLEKLEEAWKKVSGKMGGFKNKKEELLVKDKAREMIKRVMNNPGILIKKTVKIKQELPSYFLSEDQNIILCGKIDWLSYVPDDNSVHVLDFKTGKNDESEDSLQLPIYQLLLKNLQKRKVSGASYWYLDRDNEPISVKLPSVEDSYNRVIEIASKLKSSRDSKTLFCQKGNEGCFFCKPFEKIIAGDAYYVGVGGYNQDLYMI